MDKKRTEGRDLFLAEQHLLGELLHTENLAEDLDLLANIRQLQQSNEAILQQYPPKTMVEAIRRKAGKSKQNLLVHPFTDLRLVPLLAAAVLLVAVGFSAFQGFQPSSDAVVAERVKGLQPVLHIYRAEGSRVRKMEEAEAALAHDLLQLEYNGAGYSYGAIVSIDGNGVVTLHYPMSASHSTELEPGSVLLPYSYELDNAPKFERFYFVASRKPFSAEVVIEAAREIQDDENLGLSEGFVQTRFTILKEKL